MSKITLWLNDLNYNIYKWFIYSKVGSWYFDIKNGIIQLFKWRKVIYNLKDYDYNGVYELISFKLGVLADTFERNKIDVNWYESVKWIRICQKLCDKVQNEYYRYEWFDYYDSTFDFIPLNDGTGNSLMESKTTRDDLDEYFNLYPKTKEKAIELLKSKNYVKNAHENRENIAIKMGDIRHNKAKKLLFNIIQEKIEYWWD